MSNTIEEILITAFTPTFAERDVFWFEEHYKKIKNLSHMDPFWQRIARRILQMLNIRHGRLEYPPFNFGERDEKPFGKERSDEGYR